MAQIRVTLKKSLIGRKPNQVRTARALGLGRIGSSVEHQATPAVMGMIRKVEHLVDIEEKE